MFWILFPTKWCDYHSSGISSGSAFDNMTRDYEWKEAFPAYVKHFDMSSLFFSRTKQKQFLFCLNYYSVSDEAKMIEHREQ